MSASDRRRTLVDQILRLRSAEEIAPGIDEIASVRDDLERQLGPTLARGLTAHLVGVSQTALDRWIASGDIPVVMTPSGRTAIPRSVVLDLVAEVRSLGVDQRRPLASVIHNRRERSAGVETTVRSALGPLLARPATGHRSAELRSLALHSVVAERLDARAVGIAQRRLRQLERDGRIDPTYARRWDQLLSSPLAQIKRTLAEDSQDARDLRQNTPFAGVLSEPERRSILRLVA